MSYIGICCVCFKPIKEDEAIQLREDGPSFHKECVEQHPDNHYVRLEKNKSGGERSGKQI